MIPAHRFPAVVLLLMLLAAFTPLRASASSSRAGQPYGKPPILRDPLACTHITPPCSHRYAVGSVFGEAPVPPAHVSITYWNHGAAMPHLIVRIDTFGTYTISSIWASLTARGRQTRLTPRRLRTILYRGTERYYHVRERPAYIYVYDVGPFPVGAKMYIQAEVHFLRNPWHTTDLVDAYARFDAQGLPDQRAGVLGSGEFENGSVSQQTQ